jgi:hypothetical protein
MKKKFWTKKAKWKRVKSITTKFFKEFFRLFAHYLVEGYIIHVNKKKGIQFYIGKLDNNKINFRKKKYICLHTGGDIYGVKLKGVDVGDYNFKLSIEYRKKLASYLHEGKEYYN